MKKWTTFLLALCFPVLGFSFDKLDEKYLIVFGDPNAPVQITQYFSMTCPHCLSRHGSIQGNKIRQIREKKRHNITILA